MKLGEAGFVYYWLMNNNKTSTIKFIYIVIIYIIYIGGLDGVCRNLGRHHLQGPIAPELGELTNLRRL
jgi:hypothetical protein